MSMNEFRRLAAKIDQHMQQLAAEGVNDAPAIINRMMGCVPDLHKIWVGTSDDQLMALSDEFSGFYRYALVMEEASEAERNKPSRPYDGMSQLPAEAVGIYYIQFSSLSPLTRPKSLTLFVTITAPMLRAWAAISKLFEPSC